MKIEPVICPKTKEFLCDTLTDKYNKVITVVTEFMLVLKDAGYSPNTLKNYIQHLLKFFIFLEKNNISYVDAPSIKGIRMRFVRHLRELKSKRSKSKNVVSMHNTGQTPGGLSNSTLNVILGAVNSFYQVIFEEDIFPAEIRTRQYAGDKSKKGMTSFAQKGNRLKARHPVIKKNKNPPRPMPNEVIKVLVNIISSVRDLAIFFLALQGGLRLGEILGLRMEDIDHINREIKVVPRINSNRARVKNMKERTIFIEEEETWEYLNTYLLSDARLDIDSPYVFLTNKGSTKGKPLTIPGFHTVFNYYRKKINAYNNNTTFHTLRHHFATRMLENGMTIPELAELLGHTNWASTQIYTKVSNKKIKEAYRNAIKKDQ